MKLWLIEPIRDLYKGEVRAVAKKLDLPENVVKRRPFPGLAARITNEIGGVTWVAYAISSRPPSMIEPC